MPTVEPMDPPPPSKGQQIAKRGGIAAAIAAALALALPPLMTSEGDKPVGYLDIAKIPTDCFGHTGPDVHVGVAKTPEQCKAELRGDALKAMRGVLACTPELVDKPPVLSAATRLAFNIGVKGYCGSTAARLFNAGDWRGACIAFRRWNKVIVKGKIIAVKGLTDRRAQESGDCLKAI